MKTYMKIMVIGWSIACIGVFVLSYKEINFGKQVLTVELSMLKQSKNSNGWNDVLNVKSFNEPPGVAPQWFKEISENNPSKLEYKEVHKVDSNFYFIFPIYCFAIWGVPIFIFSSKANALFFIFSD